MSEAAALLAIEEMIRTVLACAKRHTPVDSVAKFHIAALRSRLGYAQVEARLAAEALQAADERQSAQPAPPSNDESEPLVPRRDGNPLS